MMWVVFCENGKMYGLYSTEKKAIEAKKRLEELYENAVVKRVKVN